MIENNVSFTLGYTNTDKTRTYSFNGVSSTALTSVESKIQAINESLAGGTDNGLGVFFRSNDYDASQSKGIFNKIVSARIESVQETYIFGGDNQ